MAGIHYFTSRPMATIGGSGGRWKNVFSFD
jgi:hypothetical protein